jgi:hypothetical protein
VSIGAADSASGQEQREESRKHAVTHIQVRCRICCVGRWTGGLHPLNQPNAFPMCEHIRQISVFLQSLKIGRKLIFLLIRSYTCRDTMTIDEVLI